MKQYQVLLTTLDDCARQAAMNMDIATDPGATPYERAMSAMVASRSLSLLMTMATELNVMVQAGKLYQEAIDPLRSQDEKEQTSVHP